MLGVQDESLGGRTETLDEPCWLMFRFPLMESGSISMQLSLPIEISFA